MGHAGARSSPATRRGRGGHVVKAAASTARFDAIAGARHSDPFSVPRPAPRRPRRRASAPCCRAPSSVTIVRSDGDPVPMERRHRAGVFEGVIEGAREIPDYRLLVTVPAGHSIEVDDPVPVRPHSQRLRPLSLRRRQSHADLRQARRAPVPGRRCRRRALRGVGAERAARQRGRRLQRLGRARPPDALARVERRVGDLRAGGARRAPLQVRAPIAARPRAAEDRSLRPRLRGAAAVGVDRDRVRVRVEGRGLDAAPRRGRRLVRPADGDLRGAPRLVGAHARGGQPLPRPTASSPTG